MYDFLSNHKNENKRQYFTVGIAVVIITLIFSPFPGIEAVSILINNENLTVDFDSIIDFDIVVRDPAAITFPQGITSETIPSNSVIKIIIDSGTANQKVALFDLLGNRLSDTLLAPGATIISSVSFNGVKKFPSGPSGSFTYGNFYGYGFGIFDGYGRLVMEDLIPLELEYMGMVCLLMHLVQILLVRILLQLTFLA